MGLNQPETSDYSSPVQVPGTTWALITGMDKAAAATKTDGTLWAWGYNYMGYLGDNSIVNKSSPIQIPGTTWPTATISKLRGFNSSFAAIKTDNTLWQWGENEKGQLGQNSRTNYSSPVQVGSNSDWGQLWCSMRNVYAIQADETP